MVPALQRSEVMVPALQRSEVMVTEVLVWAASRVFDSLVPSVSAARAHRGSGIFQSPGGVAIRVGLVGVKGTSSQARAQSTEWRGFPKLESRDSSCLTAAASRSKSMPKRPR